MSNPELIEVPRGGDVAEVVSAIGSQLLDLVARKTSDDPRVLQAQIEGFARGLKVLSTGKAWFIPND